MKDNQLPFGRMPSVRQLDIKSDFMKIMSESVCDFTDWFDVARAHKLDPHRDYVKIKYIMDYAKWWVKMEGEPPK